MPATSQIPFTFQSGQFQHIALPVCRFVFGVCPVRYPVTACIHAGIEAATARRADTGSISLGKHHTLAGEAFHVRRFVYFIIMCLFLPEREGSILPAHIIYQEENNIRPVLRFGRFSLPAVPNKGSVASDRNSLLFILVSF